MAIEGSVYERRGIDHEDERRTLLTAFNGDFISKQVKIVQIHEDAVLGGHYHKYSELFYLLEGEATFNLKHIDTENTEEYGLLKGDRLVLPARVAHKVSIKKDSVLIGCTEEPYTSPEINDHKYDF